MCDKPFACAGSQRGPNRLHVRGRFELLVGQVRRKPMRRRLVQRRGSRRPGRLSDRQFRGERVGLPGWQLQRRYGTGEQMQCIGHGLLVHGQLRVPHRAVRRMGRLPAGVMQWGRRLRRVSLRALIDSVE